MPQDSRQRLASRIGGLQTWARDPDAAAAQLAAARAARERKFESETARALYFARLSLAGAKARARNKAEREAKKNRELTAG